MSAVSRVLVLGASGFVGRSVYARLAASGVAVRALSRARQKSRPLHVNPVLVAAYVDHLGKDLSKPSVKQHLAAIRMLFDYLVVGQVLPFNPATAVRDSPVLISDSTLWLRLIVGVARG